MNTTPCPICLSENNKKVIVSHSNTYPNAKLMKCKRCNVVQFSFKELNDCEYEQYWDDHSNVEIYSQENVKNEFNKKYDYYLTYLNHVFNKKVVNLDYGCGIGNFVQFAYEKYQWESYGYDISPHAVAMGTNSGLNLYAGDLFRSEISVRKYNVITLWDVIEHVNNPRELFFNLKTLLSDNGVLVIETPNDHFIFRTMAILIYRLSFGKIKLIDYFYYTAHRFYFNAKNLEKLLKELGFQVLKCDYSNSILVKAIEKIKKNKYPLKLIVVKVLPLLFRFANCLGSQNKITMIVQLSNPEK